jgi:hypothetical protein
MPTRGERQRVVVDQCRGSSQRKERRHENTARELLRPRSPSFPARDGIERETGWQVDESGNDIGARTSSSRCSRSQVLWLADRYRRNASSASSLDPTGQKETTRNAPVSRTTSLPLPSPSTKLFNIPKLKHNTSTFIAPRSSALILPAPPSAPEPDRNVRSPPGVHGEIVGGLLD